MSNKIMTMVWESDVKGAAKRMVLLALADFADPRGMCWPHQQTIAEMCQVSERTVRRYMAEFVDEGLIECRRRRKFQSDNLYQINLDHLESRRLTPATGDRSTPATGDLTALKNPQLEPPEEKNLLVGDSQEGVGAPLEGRPDDALNSVYLEKARSDFEEIQIIEVPSNAANVFEALFEIETGQIYSRDARRRLTRSAVGAINAATRQLEEIGATPEEVVRRARNYLQTQPGDLTANALVKHWHRCDTEVNRHESQRNTAGSTLFARTSQLIDKHAEPDWSDFSDDRLDNQAGRPALGQGHRDHS